MKNHSRKFLFLLLTLVFAAGTTLAQNKSEIVGSWSESSVGATNYQNQTTGALKNGRGSSFTYKFKADGTFEYTGYMEVTTYNCTTTLFNHKTGKYVVDGAQVTLKPVKDHWKNTNSCAASGNSEKDKTPVEETYKWQVGTDDANRWALALDSGKGPMIFRRDKE